MGTSPFPQLPGWYGDPDDPNQFRYWNGEAWTFERRRRPTWVEQEARNLTAAVPARRSDAGQSTTQRADIILDGPARNLRPENLRHYRPLAPVWPDNGSFARRASASRRGRWRDEPATALRREPSMPASRFAAGPGRWPLIGFLLMCMLAMVGLASTLGLSSTSPQLSTAVATDAGYISEANAACGAVLPALRDKAGAHSSRVSTGTMSAPGSTSRAPSGGGQAGGTLAHLRVLSALRAKLGDIRASQGAAPYLTGWLDEWRSYIRDRRAYLSGTGRPDQAHLAAEAHGAAEQADRFATANGLGSCSLLSHRDSANVSF